MYCTENNRPCSKRKRFYQLSCFCCDIVFSPLLLLLNESTLQSPIAKIDHLLHNPCIAWCMLITTCRTHSGDVHASVKILNGISFKQIIWVWIMTYLFLQIIIVNVYQLHYCKLCKVSMELFKDIIEKYGTNIKYFSNYYHNESI